MTTIITHNCDTGALEPMDVPSRPCCGGLGLVLHRTVETDRMHLQPWTVSDPVTGMAVSWGADEDTAEASAIERLEIVAAANGMTPKQLLAERRSHYSSRRAA